MAAKIQMRRGTTTQWTNADPTLSVGEIGYNTTLKKFKIGDGTTIWSLLNYFVDTAGSSGSTTGNAATATALATARTFQLTGDVEASGVTFDGTGNVSLTTVIGTGAIVNSAIPKSLVTTAGDIIYRNATVPTRLGIGTAGQVLKVNSGATAPEWVTLAAASSGLVFLNRTTFSATAQANVDSIFTSTYSTYLVDIEIMTAATGSDDAHLVFRRGTVSSTSAIYGASVGASYNSAPANAGTTNGAAFIMNEYCDRFSATLYFNGVGTGTNIDGRINGTYQASSTGNAGTLGCTIADLHDWNGFGLKSSSSTITGAVTTYGLAKS